MLEALYTSLGISRFACCFSVLANIPSMPEGLPDLDRLVIAVTLKLGLIIIVLLLERSQVHGHGKKE